MRFVLVGHERKEEKGGKAESPFLASNRSYALGNYFFKVTPRGEETIVAGSEPASHRDRFCL